MAIIEVICMRDPEDDCPHPEREFDLCVLCRHGLPVSDGVPEKKKKGA